MLRIGIATSVIATVAVSLNSPDSIGGPTGVQGPTGMTSISHIQASTGSLTGIADFTGATGFSSPPTGPHFPVFPTLTRSTDSTDWSTGSSTGATGAARGEATGSTGFATATGPSAAEHIFQESHEQTIEYMKKMEALHPKGPFAQEPTYTNTTIDGEVSEQRRRSRFVAYYILPKLEHMMKVPLKNELDRTRQVLLNCRNNLDVLQLKEKKRRDELIVAKKALSVTVSALDQSLHNVASVLLPSITTAASGEQLVGVKRSFKNSRFLAKRVTTTYQEAAKVRQKLFEE